MVSSSEVDNNENNGDKELDATTPAVALSVEGSAPSPPPSRAPTADDDEADESSLSFDWTAATAFQSIAVFVAAGFAEIGGGWLVWQSVRENKPAWWAVVGSAILVLYGFIPTLQPTDSFGRVYAVYGGFFIVLSFLWSWLLDGNRPDAGDAVGGSVALVGVLVILFWPR